MFDTNLAGFPSIFNDPKTFIPNNLSYKIS